MLLILCFLHCDGIFGRHRSIFAGSCDAKSPMHSSNPDLSWEVGKGLPKKSVNTIAYRGLSRNKSSFPLYLPGPCSFERIVAYSSPIHVEIAGNSPCSSRTRRHAASRRAPALDGRGQFSADPPRQIQSITGKLGRSYDRSPLRNRAAFQPDKQGTSRSHRQAGPHKCSRSAHSCSDPSSY
jgi:hypothetical protein